MGGVGHEHCVPAGQRDVAGEHGALAAALFLGGLDQDQLSVANDLLDPVIPVQFCPALLFRPSPAQAPPRPLAAVVAFGNLIFVFLAGVRGQFLSGVGGVDVLRAIVIHFFCFSFLAREFAVASDDGLAVGDGNLEIIGVDFREAQKTVLLVSIVDKSRLQRRLNANHLGKVDVAPDLRA